MPKVTFLPFGKTIQVTPGRSLLEAAVEACVDLEHACGGVCACSTCHVIVKEGYDRLVPATEDEEDMLDVAVGVTPTSRLACQTKVVTDVVVEVPRHSRNLVREGP